jgi:hypothetical protein
MERKVHRPLKTDRGLRARMKAIRIHEYGGVGTLKQEVPRNFSITDDQVLVRIQDASLNPVDWKVRATCSSCAANGATSTFEKEESVNSILISRVKCALEEDR